MSVRANNHHSKQSSHLVPILTMAPSKKEVDAPESSVQDDVSMADANEATSDGAVVAVDAPEDDGRGLDDVSRIAIVGRNKSGLWWKEADLKIVVARCFGHGCVVSIHKWRSHAGECAALYHYEKVCIFCLHLCLCGGSGGSADWENAS